MKSATRLILTSPADQAGYIEARVTAGAYESAERVVCAALDALQDRNAGIERWLREDVVPTYDDITENPCSGRSAEDVLDALRRHHQQRVSRAKRGNL